jgi:hypothetical protein
MFDSNEGTIPEISTGPTGNDFGNLNAAEWFPRQIPEIVKAKPKTKFRESAALVAFQSRVGECRFSGCNVVSYFFGCAKNLGPFVIKLTLPSCNHD